jgi:predicted dehydrogenase
MDRRSFVNKSAALLAGYSATVSGYAANESISVGVLGAGGRARRLLQSLNQIPGTNVVAVADVWDASLEQSRKFAVPGAHFTKRYEDVLSRKDVDAVLIASPDHWHVAMATDACSAGKDVYVEKPLTHDLSEGSRIIEAEKRSGRIVQVGMQQRSMPHLIKARELLKAGRLGSIHKVHMTWNRNTPRATAASIDIDPKTVDWDRFLGNAPKQNFDPYRFRNWRWFWDFGGGIFTDLMVHWLDTVNWMMDLDPPAVATAIGDNYNAKNLWQTPDTVQGLLQYPERELQAYFEGTFVNARNAAMTEIMGSDATLYFDRGRFELIPERKRNGSPVAAEEMVLGTGPRGADFYDQPDGELLHLTNWLECVRSRKPPAATAEDGVRSAAGAHLANMALRQNKVIRWQDEQPRGLSVR